MILTPNRRVRVGVWVDAGPTHCLGYAILQTSESARQIADQLDVSTNAWLPSITHGFNERGEGKGVLLSMG